MEIIKTDTVIIGGGPAGYVAGIKLGQLNIDTILVEKNILGGVCLNIGCIPSKVLISAGRRIVEAKNGEELGITGGENLSLNLEQLQVFKRKTVKKLTDGVGALLKANGTKVMYGEAQFIDPKKLKVTDSDNNTKEIEFKHAMICSGSVPVSLPFIKEDGEVIIGSTEALSLEKLPEKMVIIGGGVIGLELGQFYGQAGCEITVVEAMDQILPGMEKDVVKTVTRQLKKSNMKIHTSSKVTSVERIGLKAEVKVETKKGELVLTADKVLVTIGRKPSFSHLKVENIGLNPEDRFIKVDSHLRTEIDGIYAAGDVTGGPLLAHRASSQAEVAALNIAGEETTYKPLSVPAVCYTTPEIATVGLTSSMMEEKGMVPKEGKFLFAASGRALASNHSQGFIKYLADEKTDEICGVQIVGHEASELISEAILAVENRITAKSLGDTMHAHPTLGESAMEAAKAVNNEAIHQLPRKK